MFLRVRVVDNDPPLPPDDYSPLQITSILSANNAARLEGRVSRINGIPGGSRRIFSDIRTLKFQLRDSRV